MIVMAFGLLERVREREREQKDFQQLISIVFVSGNSCDCHGLWPSRERDSI